MYCVVFVGAELPRRIIFALHAGNVRGDNIRIADNVRGDNIALQTMSGKTKFALLIIS